MIVLWELGVVVRFPAGSSVMFVSGHITHFNLPIADDETRWSFTQYMAQALMTFIANNSRKYDAMEETERKKAKRAAAQRSVTEVRLYSTIESLAMDRLRLVEAAS